MRQHGIAVRQRRPAELPQDWPLARAALDAIIRPTQLNIERMLRASRPLGKAEAIIRISRQTQRPITLPVKVSGDADKLYDELLGLGVSLESCAKVKAEFDKLPESADLHDLAMTLALERPMDEGEKGAFVGTIHSAKGKEFDRVILAAFEEEVIPGTSKRTDAEEERRLAYVGMTRARNDLTFTWAQWRRASYGARVQEHHRASRFIGEADL
jgi:DNA helicase-2/ATP-dependent DNA helicase PcrA